MTNDFQPPYYAVIFTSTLKPNAKGYEAMAKKMLELVKKQPGFLGVDSVRDGLGITVSYWKTLADIKRWKMHPEHQLAIHKGKNLWYDTYALKICKVSKQ